MKATQIGKAQGDWELLERAFPNQSPRELGPARGSQDTLEFSLTSNVHPGIDKYPLSQLVEVYEQMHSAKPRFRVVLTMEG